jgi:hypothetical protein
MANHYIRQDLERRMILLGLTDEEIAVYINVAVDEKLRQVKEEEKS